MTSTWSTDELAAIGGAEELQIASRRVDETLRSFITIWVVRTGDHVYVRSAYGPENPWYRRALASGRGRIRAGGVERDVTFEPVPTDPNSGDDAHAAIDAAYHAKYDRHGPAIVGTVVGATAAQATLRLLPA